MDVLLTQLEQHKDASSNIQLLGNILRNIGLKLNSDDFNEWNLFYAHNSYKIFTNLFDYFFIKIDVNDSNYLSDNDDLLKDLLQCIFTMTSKSIRSNNYFREEGLFEIILNLFGDEHLMRHLNTSKPILIKIMRIFFHLSKSIYLSENSTGANKYRAQLKANIRIIKNLSEESEINENNALYRMYFVSVSYLQEKLMPVESIIETDDIRNFAKIGILQSLFKTTSDHFEKNCNVVKLEFINELGEIESNQVHDLFKIANENTPVNSVASLLVPDLLNTAIVIWSTSWKSDEIKLMGYENFKHFYRSIIFYGFDTEKMLAIKILKNFCSNDKLKAKIFKDKELIEYLNSLKAANSLNQDINIRNRLTNIISSLLQESSS